MQALRQSQLSHQEKKMLKLRLWKILKIKKIFLAEKEIGFYNFALNSQ